MAAMNGPLTDLKVKLMTRDRDYALTVTLTRRNEHLITEATGHFLFLDDSHEPKPMRCGLKVTTVEGTVVFEEDFMGLESQTMMEVEAAMAGYCAGIARAVDRSEQSRKFVQSILATRRN